MREMLMAPQASQPSPPPKAVQRRRYLLFYKPYGVLCSFTDDEGRPTLGAYISMPDIYAAGRLDLDSEGLLLLTDDGALAHRLTHPDHMLPKTYLVQAEGVPDASALARLRAGVEVKGQITAPAEVELLAHEPQLPARTPPIRHRETIPTSWLRIVLREGRKRQVRHMTAAVGHPTLRLVRVAIGPLTLEGLEPGEWRDLTAEELAILRRRLFEQPPAPHASRHGKASSHNHGERGRADERSQGAPAPARGPRWNRHGHHASRRRRNPGVGGV
jgi:23S rRNA pseudouridine2457 synthase